MKRRVALIGAVLLGTACGRPALMHLDGHPFAPVRPLVQLGDGWMAVDSCAAGVHALVEVVIPTRSGAGVQLPDDLHLALETGEVHHPTRIEMVGPLCWSEAGDAGPQADWARRESVPGELTGCRGVVLLQAQFDLMRLPADGGTVVLLRGGTQTTLGPPGR